MTSGRWRPVPRRLLSPFWVVALTLAAHAAGAERLPVRIYDAADGLAADEITSLLEDRPGFLWVGTSAGLTRFDGERFKSYGAEHGIAPGGVNDVLQSRDGTIWLAVRGGIARLDPRAEPAALFTVVPFGTSSHKAICLFEDSRGRLWAGTFGDGLWVLDDVAHSSLRRVDLGLPAGSSVGSISEGPPGEVWASSTRGLHRLSADGGHRAYPVAPVGQDDWVGALRTDSQGNLWIGSAAGVFVWRPPPLDAAGAAELPSLRELAQHARAAPGSPGVVRLPRTAGEVMFFDRGDGLPANAANQIIESASGEIWVATTGGVAVLRDGHALRAIGVAQGLSEGLLTAIALDRHGQVWVGTVDHGLMRFAGGGLVSFGVADGLASDHISSIFDGPTGELYVASSGARLHRFDGRRFEEVTPTVLDGVARAWGSHQFVLNDRAGEWWMPSGAGLFRFAAVAQPRALRSAPPLARYQRAQGLTGDEVQALYEDRHGDVWVALAGVPPPVRWTRASATLATVPLPPTGQPGGVTAFAEDTNGDLWMGFFFGGLVRLRDGTAVFFGPSDDFPVGQVWDLHFDHAGRLWVATPSGLARLDQPAARHPSVRLYTVLDGLSANSIECIAEDDRGRLYVGTVRGFDRLDPGSGEVRTLTTADGLPASRVHVCHWDRDGNLWLGTLRGLVRFQPARESPPQAPAVRLSGVRVGGVAQRISELGEQDLAEIEIPPERNSLHVEFDAISHGFGDNVRFRHRLVGSPDTAWTPRSRERAAFFPALPPGRYRFEVQAVAAAGPASAPASVAFRVLPPLWRQWWFLAGSTLLVAATLTALVRARIARLLALERMRTRIAADLHDDVGASLSQLAFLSDLAHQHGAVDPAASRKLLVQVAAEARSLIESTSDIVWAINPRRDDLRSLLARLRWFATELAAARELRLHCELPADESAVALTPERRRELYLLLKEALNNAAKHAAASSLGLRLEVRADGIHAEVSDDGVGFDPARQSDGHGLENLRTRARRLGGEIEIDSTPGAGTRVRLRAPLQAGRRMRMRLLRGRRASDSERGVNHGE